MPYVKPDGTVAKCFYLKCKIDLNLILKTCNITVYAPTKLLFMLRYNYSFPSCEDHIICMDFSHSVDLELQTNVKSAQSLPSAQDFIKQGLLLPSASPYEVKSPYMRVFLQLFCN